MTTEQLNLGTSAVVGVVGGVWKYYLKPELKPERILAGAAALYLGARLLESLRD